MKYCIHDTDAVGNYVGTAKNGPFGVFNTYCQKHVAGPFRFRWMAQIFLSLCHRHDQGLYGLARDEEANAHYGIQENGISGMVWRMRCYIRGFFLK